jgi:hypothetical protein
MFKLRETSTPSQKHDIFSCLELKIVGFGRICSLIFVARRKTRRVFSFLVGFRIKLRDLRRFSAPRTRKKNFYAPFSGDFAAIYVCYAPIFSIYASK